MSALRRARNQGVARRAPEVAGGQRALHGHTSGGPAGANLDIDGGENQF
ncbi:hypothetical protein [Amycolatopsis sp. NBC_01480]|nr:hypothetical protein [Amycolatopsis sp. NBC_01480]